MGRKERFLSRLSQFFNSKTEAQRAINDVLEKNPDIEADDHSKIFHEVTKGEGPLSTHISGKPENSIREGKFISKRKGRRKW